MWYEVVSETTKNGGICPHCGVSKLACTCGCVCHPVRWYDTDTTCECGTERYENGDSLQDHYVDWLNEGVCV